MIQSRFPYRDMVWHEAGGERVVRYNNPIRENVPLASQHSVFKKEELFDDPYKWDPAESYLYTGMLVYVIDEMQIYCLDDVDKWRSEEGWKKYKYKTEDQDEFMRLKKLDNLLR